MNPVLSENDAGMDDTYSKLLALHEECEGWKRMLEVLMYENVDLKTRLAEQVKKSSANGSFVIAAEQFNSSFMREDEIIRLARRDVAELDKILKQEVPENGISFKDVMRKHKRLRKELSKIEKEFNKLKLGFNNFLNKLL